ncbi:MAG: hypothetical protein V9G04_10355 [Nocardioides sp.]
MQHILEAIQSGTATSEDFASLEVPDHYRAAFVKKDEVGMFEGVASQEKDPRKSLHVDDVAAARTRPGRGSGGRDGQRDQLQHRVDLDLRAGVDLRLPGAVRPQLSPLSQAARPALPRGRLGPGRRRAASTGAGVQRLASPATRSWRTASRSSSEAPTATTTRCSTREQRIWGFETNFGGLAEIALVKSNQLMPKPAHLTWEEAASPGLVNSTAYRQLVSANGGNMKQGDNVLIWGASGGLGGFATQYALNGGAQPDLRGVQRGEGRRSAARWALS